MVEEAEQEVTLEDLEHEFKEIEHESQEVMKELEQEIQKWKTYYRTHKNRQDKALAKLWIRVCRNQQNNEMVSTSQALAIHALYSKHVPNFVTWYVSHILDHHIEDTVKQKAQKEARLEANRILSELFDDIRKRRKGKRDSRDENN